MTRSARHKAPIVLIAGGVLLTSSMFAAPAFKDISPAELEFAARSGAATPWIQPQRFRSIEIDADAMTDILVSAPHEDLTSARSSAPILDLPLPDGRERSFRVIDSPIMAPGLEQWFVDQGYPMKTYKVVATDDSSVNGRIDFGGPHGFHAMITTEEGTFYIDRYWQENTDLYTSYFRNDLERGDDGWMCHFEEDKAFKPRKINYDRNPHTRTGGNLRSYDTAVACTGEYTAFHGGTVVAGQAAIVTTMNRVNQVSETDLSFRYVLVANNDNLVYTNSGSDPYSNNSGFSMLSQNQSNIDSVIGSGNYDIGHVFSTGGGGVASLGSLCSNGSKAQGVTGQPAPTGDPFDIDYVSHELGHQLGALHTFNSTSGACGGGNRSGSAAYEPGSASTIMGYAGICGSNDLQPNSDPYYHLYSLIEIFDHIDNGGGNCHTLTAGVNPNQPVAGAGANYTIPANTPFELTATGSDSDGDGTLNYCWEQFDLGPATSLSQGDTGSGPIFRSFDPVLSPTRTFPRLSSILDGTNGGSSVGESLPATNRSMTFRVTVRDNDPDGGRWDDDETVITVSNTGAPFAVTSPNGGESVSGVAIVTWNVSGTDAAPINATNVDILMSDDGGQTFPYTLASGVANDGTEGVPFPNITTSQARLKIRGSGNVFFDISNSNFSVSPGTPEPLFGITEVVLNDVGGNGNGNGFAEPGESLLELQIRVENFGTQDATSVSALVSTAASGVTLVSDSSAYPDLTSGNDGVAASTFVFAIDPSWNCGDSIQFDFDVTSTEKNQALAFSIPTGEAQVSTQATSFETAEDLSGWTSNAAAGPDNWNYRTSGASDGTASTGSYLASFEPGADAVGDARLVSPAITVTEGMSAEFQHGYNIESGYDGAVLEISTNGGTSWSDAASIITSGEYTSSISTSFSSPIGGRSAWSGSKTGMSAVTLDLSGYVGQTIQLRWRWTSDQSVDSGGWWIDDFVLTTSETVCQPISGSEVEQWIAF